MLCLKLKCNKASFIDIFIFKLISNAVKLKLNAVKLRINAIGLIINAIELRINAIGLRFNAINSNSIYKFLQSLL